MMNIAVIELASLFFTFWHEVGHALAAKLCGWRVFRIEIGKGRIAKCWKLWGFRWVVRALPVGGMAFGAPRSQELFRLKNIIFALGGPAANAAVVCSLLPAVVDGAAGLTGVLEGFDPLLMIWLVNLAFVVITMWPFHFETARGTQPNDGMIVWNTLVERYRWDRDTQTAALLWECSELLEDAQVEAAKARLAPALESDEKAPSLRYLLAAIKLAERSYREAAALYEDLLRDEKASSEWRGILHNNLAWAHLMTGDAAALALAREHSAEAMKVIAWVPCVRGTRGAVMVESGELDEGCKLLMDAYRLNETRQDRATNLAFLAKAAYVRSEIQVANQLVKRALSLDPDNEMARNVNSGRAA